MNDQTDAQLLRAYAEHRSEPAFGELVRRHVALVHSAAVRMVCDAHLAQDVTQGVFVALAKSASDLMDHPVLSGWLHRTAQNIAAQTVRTDVRRRAREQEAATMNQLHSADPETTWENLAPHLDTALGELTEADRDALLLRYFEKKSAPEMAGLLGISEEAAQKRVTRAVDRLRELFSQRKVTIGAGGLVVLISANAVQAVPAAFATTITTAAITGTAASTSTLVAATKIIAMTTLQKTLVTATVTILAGAGLYEARHAAQLSQQNQALLQSQAALGDELRQLQRERDTATNRLASAADDAAAAKSSQSELLALRGEVTRLRQAASDTKPPEGSRAALVQSWLAREDQLRQSVAQHPDKAIPEFKLLSDQQWLDEAMSARFDTDDQVQKALASLRQTADNDFASQAVNAISKYMATNNGAFPANVSELQTYFSPPIDEDILQRWKVAPKSANPSVGVGDMIITEKVPVDASRDRNWAIGAHGFGSGSYETADMTADIALLTPVMKAYAADHGGAEPGDPSQIVPYLTTPEQQAAFKKLMAKEKAEQAGSASP